MGLFLSVILFCILIFNFPVDSDLDSDRKALLKFASAFPNSRRILNWFSSNSTCSDWVGVTCSKNGANVIGLHLPGRRLSGSIPVHTLAYLDYLIILSLRSNNLSGELPPDVLSLPHLEHLNLQHNQLFGSIPASSSQRLRVLDLSFNSFSGSIPSSLPYLPNLRKLRLQNNDLTGSIPALNSTALKVFNVSTNNLNGSIPPSLQKFPHSSFEGNPLLCGSPIKPCSPSQFSPVPNLNHSSSPSLSSSPVTGGEGKGQNKGIVIGIAVSSLGLIFMVAVVEICSRKKYANKRTAQRLKTKFEANDTSREDFDSGGQEGEKNKLVFFEKSSNNFNLEDLLRASAEVLGKGSSGTTYRAAMEEGITIVVKRLRQSFVGKREFEQQMEALRGISQHQNVMPLRGYYFSKDEKLLLYDYMAAGSLFTLLHGDNEASETLSNWRSRLGICLGVGKGIGHIHAASKGKVIHGNIKSSNILLTEDLDGVVSEFGFHSIIYRKRLRSRVGGYQAPEVMETMKQSPRSDVYSFGIILLEILTGKIPMTMDLPRWVQSVVREEWTSEVFDARLTRHERDEEQMMQLLQIAMSCVEKTPNTRPTMAQVITMIEALRSG